jgi:replicative DNA helicase
MGKTSLLLNFGLAAAQRFQQRVLVFSLEMSCQQITERLVAQRSEIDSQRLRFGQLTDDDWPRLVQATGQLGDVPLWMTRPACQRGRCARRRAGSRLSTASI